jgi:UDP-3-O-[3-hydroxymyristoyl] glucosamine N-acyltransferase
VLLKLTLKEIAAEVNAEIVGDPDCQIEGVATIQNATSGSITFLSNRSYKKYLESTDASAVILTRDDVSHCPVSALIVENPYLVYARVASLLNPPEEFGAGVHPSAVVMEGCKIAKSAFIGANCVIERAAQVDENCYIAPGSVIGEQSRIGANTRLYSNVTVYHDVTIGRNCILHSGVVVGSDGFGIANDNGVWEKVPQLGSVRIGDNVEIGANTTIDRGALEDTVIEDGVKLDNQIQVAHNVIIGAHTAIAGCVGIAGSAHIGRYCAIGGGAVILGHLKIADKVQITAMSMVTKSIKEPGVYSSGTPLQPNHLWHKNFVRFRQLDEMARKIRELEKKLEQE